MDSKDFIKAFSTEGLSTDQQMFNKIQEHFAEQFEKFFPDRFSKKCIVVIPSLTLDPHLLDKINGHIYYEERLLCLLMLLRMPLTKIIYLTSMPVDTQIIDYYLQYIPGITRDHALKRLTMLTCYDSSSKSLTEKIIERPNILRRIKNAVGDDYTPHLACFNVTNQERRLAIKLNMPIYGCSPDLIDLGNKSNGKKIFRCCGLNVAFGREDITDFQTLVEALVEIKLNNPALNKAVLKLNEGFSGEGNAIYTYPSLVDVESFTLNVATTLTTLLKPVAKDLSAEQFLEDLYQHGGIAEEFLHGDVVMSPSVQCRINPLGDCKVISTHDQIVGGDDGQVYKGAYFPAHQEYAVEIGKAGLKVAAFMKDLGVIGRLGIDFMSIKTEDKWTHYAVEINLRKGGTTHPYILLQMLTDGDYNHKTGHFLTANHQKRFYLCTDNLEDDCYKGLTPPDLIDIAILKEIQYNSTRQEGVMFHLIGALSQYGKIGMICIGSSHERAKMFYNQTVELLHQSCMESKREI